MQAVSSSMARMWQNKFKEVRRRIKISRNEDATSSSAVNYQQSGLQELPRRIKDISSAVTLNAIVSVYSKFATFHLTYPSTVTNVIEATVGGFTGAITGTISSNQLTLTSADSEFTNFAGWDSNQKQDITIDSFSGSTWVFGLPSGNWGDANFIIYIS